MKTFPLTPKLQRQRKFLLGLPVLVLPFLTLLFWSMKSKDGSLENPQSDMLPGLNTHLPGAQFKDTGSVDKLSFYEQADAASRKLKQERDQDPYAKQTHDSSTNVSVLAFDAKANQPSPASLQPVSLPDHNERQIYERLNKLQQAMNRSTPASTALSVENGKYRPERSYTRSIAGEDPELRQMNSIMEKLVQLQHPESIKPAAASKRVSKSFRAVRAVIDGKQRITDNTVIRMKLLDSVSISGQSFPKGQLVYAAGMFSNQRLKLDIKSIHIGNIIYPVDLTVYDAEDGLEGISMPEAITEDALRNGASSGVQSMALMSLDPSISAQLATAGVNTAKGLFSKKVKQIKAKLQDQRALLLRINQPVAGNQGTSRQALE